MRHKYDTKGIVLSRTHVGEATTYVSLLTPDLGLVYARAQSLRKPGAKLSPALITFAESEVTLVRGKESWRISGALLTHNWFLHLPSVAAREVAGRIATLVLRLVPGEVRDTGVYAVLAAFFEALAQLPPQEWEAAEILTALRLLSALGLDAGELPGVGHTITQDALLAVRANQSEYIARINKGITASGL